MPKINMKKYEKNNKMSCTQGSANLYQIPVHVSKHQHRSLPSLSGWAMEMPRLQLQQRNVYIYDLYSFVYVLCILCIYIYIYVCVCVIMYIYIYMCVCVRSICIYIYIYIYICVCVCVCVRSICRNDTNVLYSRRPLMLLVLAGTSHLSCCHA